MHLKLGCSSDAVTIVNTEMFDSWAYVESSIDESETDDGVEDNEVSVNGVGDDGLVNDPSWLSTTLEFTS